MSAEATAEDADAPPGDASEDLAETVPDPKEVTRKPTTLSGGLSLMAAVTVMALGGLHSVLGFGLAAMGLAALALAVVVGSRTAADAGGALLLLSVVGIGTVGDEPAVLAAAVMTVLAWDLATNAIGMGEQLGREADTDRAELVHAAATLFVGALTAGVAFATFNLAAGGQPVTALVLLLLAALALVSALRL